MKSPIFIFSLPRSGSTLLQRVLMSHDEISSVSEPWLLLPLIYTFKKEGVVSVFSQANSHAAHHDFIANLPNGIDDYNAALREFVLKLFQQQCNNNEIYFLDKTPRYHLIIPEIFELFPDAKFIFLFRNPVHVMSSMINTWGNGRLNNLWDNQVDLNEGFKNISNGYEKFKDQAFAIQYEEFVVNPEKSLKNLFEYLELEWESSLLTSFSQQNLKGQMGDPTGVKLYNKIEQESLNKWKNTFNTAYRKKIIKTYISNIAPSVFEIQGYSKEKIIREINETPSLNKLSINDRVDVLYSRLVQYFKLNLFFGKKNRKWFFRSTVT